ncbi:MAG: hypothetical protein ACO1N0_08840 [Fluviicola sp.]
MKKLLPILFPLAIILLIDVFSVRAVYQRCTCPELFLIDPIESLLLNVKYSNDETVRTMEIYPEEELSPDGPSPTFTTMTHFGYYLNSECEDRDCKVRYPQFRILFSVPTFLMLILEGILFVALFRFLKTRG